MKKLLYLLPIILISSTASAQTVRVSTSSTGTVVPTQASIDSAKRNIRNEIAALRAEMLRNVVRLRPGTVDSLNRLNVLLNELSTRIAQQGASLSTLNATLAGAVAVNNSQALQLSSQGTQIGQLGVTIQQLQEQVKAAIDAANAAKGTVDNLKNYLKATP